MQRLGCRARRDSQFLAQQLAQLVIGGERGCSVTARGERPHQQPVPGLGQRGLCHQAACGPLERPAAPSPRCPGTPRYSRQAPVRRSPPAAGATRRSRAPRTRPGTAGARRTGQRARLATHGASPAVPPRTPPNAGTSWPCRGPPPSPPAAPAARCAGRDLSGREQRADLRQQHCQCAGRSGAAFGPKGVEHDCPLDWLRTVGGEVCDQQRALPAGKPRLDLPPIDYDGELPAQLDPYHALSVRFNVSATYRPKIVTRPGPDNRRQKEQADGQPGDLRMRIRHA